MAERKRSLTSLILSLDRQHTKIVDENGESDYFLAMNAWPLVVQRAEELHSRRHGKPFRKGHDARRAPRNMEVKNGEQISQKASCDRSGSVEWH